MKNLLSKLAIIALCLSLASCSGAGRGKKEKKKKSAEISYTKAMKLLKEKDYVGAAEKFSKISDDYPFSKWAIKGQVIAIYSYYRYEDYEKIISEIDDFLRLNPNSEYVPYVLYIKGITYYNQIPNIDRGQDDTKKASIAFRELIARFHYSEFAKDAKTRLRFVDEHLAGAKMSLGRKQIQLNNYVGAIESFLEVTNRHRASKQLPEAYFRLYEVYYKVGLKKESRKAISQLENKFPGNHWTNLALENYQKLN